MRQYDNDYDELDDFADLGFSGAEAIRRMVTEMRRSDMSRQKNHREKRKVSWGKNLDWDDFDDYDADEFDRYSGLNTEYH